MDLTIKNFEKEYIEQLRSVYAYYVENTSITFDMHTPSSAEYLHKIESLAKRYPCLIALNGDEVIGFAYGSSFRDKAAFDQTVELTIYLNPDYKGKGVGGKLMNELLRILKEMHFRMAVSVITVPNEGSDRLHNSFGFKKMGVLPNAGYKFDQYWDVVYMYKDLA